MQNHTLEIGQNDSNRRYPLTTFITLLETLSSFWGGHNEVWGRASMKSKKATDVMSSRVWLLIFIWLKFSQILKTRMINEVFWFITFGLLLLFLLLKKVQTLNWICLFAKYPTNPEFSTESILKSVGVSNHFMTSIINMLEVWYFKFKAQKLLKTWNDFYFPQHFHKNCAALY